MSTHQNMKKRRLIKVDMRELGREPRKNQMVMMLVEASESFKNTKKGTGSNERTAMPLLENLTCQLMCW